MIGDTGRANQSPIRPTDADADAEDWIASGRRRALGLPAQTRRLGAIAYKTGGKIYLRSRNGEAAAFDEWSWTMS